MKYSTLNDIHDTEKINDPKIDETPNNVLDFSTTLRELRKTVDPALIRPGRIDRKVSG